MLRLTVAPVTRDEANAVIEAWHRHHQAVRSHRFAVGAFTGYGGVAGVIVVGNPIAPELAADRTVMEILRSATHWNAGPLHAQGLLYGAARRAAVAMGCRRLITYTRVDESGRSLQAVGFHRVAVVRGRGHNTGNRALRWLPGLYEPATEVVDRVRWESGPDCTCASCRPLGG